MHTSLCIPKQRNHNAVEVAHGKHGDVSVTCQDCGAHYEYDYNEQSQPEFSKTYQIQKCKANGTTTKGTT